MRDRLRYALLTTAAVSGVATFLAFVFYERPGLGVGHLFYISIMLAALATGPAIGAGAAVAATAMFASGVLLNPHIPPSEVLTTSTGIRFVTYMTVGIVTGYFAKRSRLLMGELQLLADRDALTGLPNTRAFERRRSANDSPGTSPSRSSSAASTSSRRRPAAGRTAPTTW
jgi:K+-sensing histidine kinase KdpD